MLLAVLPKLSSIFGFFGAGVSPTAAFAVAWFAPSLVGVLSFLRLPPAALDFLPATSFVGVPDREPVPSFFLPYDFHRLEIPIPNL